MKKRPSIEYVKLSDSLLNSNEIISIYPLKAYLRDYLSIQCKLSAAKWPNRAVCKEKKIYQAKSSVENGKNAVAAKHIARVRLIFYRSCKPICTQAIPYGRHKVTLQLRERVKTMILICITYRWDMLTVQSRTKIFTCRIVLSHDAGFLFHKYIC